MIIDLTHSLSESIPIYPSKTRFSRKKHELKNGVCLNDISLSSGIGTHMDAPRHFYAEGKSIDQIPLERFFVNAFFLILCD
jgi:kynurenine formamidase